MKLIIAFLFIVASTASIAQTKVNPVIKNYGSVFEIPYAEEKPDPSMEYKIIVEVARASEKPDTLNWALNNVARLINLHVMAGVPKEKITIVMAIHGGAAYTVLNNEAYKEKYGVDNPNLGIYKELKAAGIKLFVCGQSLIVRNIDRTRMVPEVKIATSMLTTLTTYQLKGYALLVFN